MLPKGIGRIMVFISKRKKAVYVSSAVVLFLVLGTEIGEMYDPYRYDHLDHYRDAAERQKLLGLGGMLKEFSYVERSSYYTSTTSKDVLKLIQENYPKFHGRGERFAIVRPFCEFDAGPLPTTFDIWETYPPCDLESKEAKNTHMPVDLFLSYSQTYSENEIPVQSVDEIIQNFYDGKYVWSVCFENVYAIEMNIRADVDNYIPPLLNYLSNWFNGPNRQFERDFRTIQSKEWGSYDTFYSMEGGSIPNKKNWLNAILEEVERKQPFAILGSNFQIETESFWSDFNKDYIGTDNIEPFRKERACGNQIYNVSHPLLEAFVSHLEVEAPSPYNSIPFDDRLVQLMREGMFGEIAKIHPRIMLNDEGNYITLANNTDMLRRWVNLYSPLDRKEELDPFKTTGIIRSYNYQATSADHLGNEYVFHGIKLYDSWKKQEINITLVISDDDSNRTDEILADVQDKDHPFTEVIVMGDRGEDQTHEFHSYGRSYGRHYDGKIDTNYTELYLKKRRKTIKLRYQKRVKDYPSVMDPKRMDLCQARIDISSEWFMLMDSSHDIRDDADLLVIKKRQQHHRQKSKHKRRQRIYDDSDENKRPEFSYDYEPVVAFTPAVFPELCSEHNDCWALEMLAQKIWNDMVKVYFEWDVPFFVDFRNSFCDEWERMNGLELSMTTDTGTYANLHFNRLQKRLQEKGVEISDLYDFIGPRGPTAAEYFAFLAKENKDRGYYISADRTLYMQKSPFVKTSAKS